MHFDPQAFKSAITNRLKRQYGKNISQANKHDLYDALAAAVLESVMENWMKTRQLYEKEHMRQVCYFSAEFLMGRALGNNIINTLIKPHVVQVLEEMGFDYNSIEDEEPDAALGNGGLGRLAATRGKSNAAI